MDDWNVIMTCLAVEKEAHSDVWYPMCIHWCDTSRSRSTEILGFKIFLEMVSPFNFQLADCLLLHVSCLFLQKNTVQKHSSHIGLTPVLHHHILTMPPSAFSVACYSPLYSSYRRRLRRIRHSRVLCASAVWCPAATLESLTRRTDS